MAFASRDWYSDVLEDCGNLQVHVKDHDLLYNLPSYRRVSPLRSSASPNGLRESWRGMAQGKEVRPLNPKPSTLEPLNPKPLNPKTLNPKH